MNNSSKDTFKKNLDKAFSSAGVTMNPSTMKDHMKYKTSFKEQQELEGGLGDEMTLKKIAKKHDVSMNHIIDEFSNGVDVEKEHTSNIKKAMEIAMDHLTEDPNYYTKLKKIESKGGDKVSAKKQFSKDLQSDKDFIEFKKRAKYKQGYKDFNFGTPNVTHDDPYIKKRKWSRPGKEETKEATGTGSSGAYSGPLFGGETKFIKKSQSETPKLKEGIATGAMGLDKVEAKEATGSGSVGGYSSPSMWAKSTKKKDWGPSRKTQVPGGSFVKVKKKCTKFPYCNQGDINALHITKNESVKEAIRKVSKKLNIGENVIINILEHEYSKNKKGNN